MRSVIITVLLGVMIISAFISVAAFLDGFLFSTQISYADAPSGVGKDGGFGGFGPYGGNGGGDGCGCDGESGDGDGCGCGDVGCN